MSNKVAIFALICVCIGIGALAGGLGVYYGKPFAQSQDVQLRTAQCVLVSDNVAGTLQFSQSMGKKIVITGNITGLTEGKHGFHIHQYGIVGDDCSSAKGHFNPYNMDHGMPTSEIKHVGDMGNIETMSDNTPTIVDEREQDVSLFEPVSIIGRGLVIHARADDFTQPTGNAGGRVACCTIMYVNPDNV